MWLTHHLQERVLAYPPAFPAATAVEAAGTSPLPHQKPWRPTAPTAALS